MSIRSWVIIVLALMLVLPWHAAADEIADPAESIGEVETSDPTEEVDDPIFVVVTEPPVYMEVLQDTGSALVHANLFGAFLICGTLVGLFLLRGRYGT